MIEWLKPRESIKRLLFIMGSFSNTREDVALNARPDVAKPTIALLDALFLLLSAHIKVVQELNLGVWKNDILQEKREKILSFFGFSGKEYKDKLDCNVPWDQEINLPPFPILAADAAFYVELFQPKDARLSCLLTSFSAWSLFAKQEISCACGARRLRLRKVCDDIMVNHAFHREDKFFSLIQLIGVKSSDNKHNKHLKSHFSVNELGKINNEFFCLVSQSSAMFKVASNEISCVADQVKSAEMFNLDEFNRQIESVANLVRGRE